MTKLDEHQWKQQRIIKDSHKTILDLEQTNKKLQEEVRHLEQNMVVNKDRNQIVNEMLEDYFRSGQYE